MDRSERASSHEAARGREEGAATPEAGHQSKPVNSLEAELFWHTVRANPTELPTVVRLVLRGSVAEYVPPRGHRPFDLASVPTRLDPALPIALRSSVAATTRSMRPHQWAKNLLVFVPLLAGQRAFEVEALVATLAAFVGFSATASVGYLFNDLLDLEADRQHPTKRHRPLASGAMPMRALLVLVPGLVALAAVATWTLPPAYTFVLAGYLGLTVGYTVRLKQTILLDVLTLSGLYTTRILAGSAATGIQPSVWLLGLSFFLFLSLALLKRYAELHASLANDSGPDRHGAIPGRGYRNSDLPVLVAFGAGTGCMAVLVLALYIISDEVAAHYTHPWLVWQLCPLALYWIARAWIVVARDEMPTDPVVWAGSDQLSRWTILVAIAVLVLAA